MTSSFLPSLRLNEPCGRIVCGPGWTRTRENSLRLADAELWLVWRGRGWMATRDRKLALFPGFCALMRPGGIYDAGHDEAQPLGITYIHFQAGPGRKRPEAAWPEFFEVDDLDFYDAATRRIVQLFHGAPETAAALLRGLLLDLLRLPPGPRPGRGNSAPPPFGIHRQRIARLTASLHAAPGRLPGVEEMARELHMSPAHFGRVFRAATGRAPRDFLIETRLSRARHLLAETSLPVGEIAERLGYADVFFFSRQFKEKTGVSPRQYRERV